MDKSEKSDSKEDDPNHNPYKMGTYDLVRMRINKLMDKPVSLVPLGIFLMHFLTCCTSNWLSIKTSNQSVKQSVHVKQCQLSYFHCGNEPYVQDMRKFIVCVLTVLENPYCF